MNHYYSRPDPEIWLDAVISIVSPECRSAENPCSSSHSQVGSVLLCMEWKLGISWCQSMSVLLIKYKMMKNLLRNFLELEWNECISRDLNLISYLPILSLFRNSVVKGLLLKRIIYFAEWTRPSLESCKNKLLDSALWQKFFKEMCKYIFVH